MRLEKEVIELRFNIHALPVSLLGTRTAIAKKPRKVHGI